MDGTAIEINYSNFEGIMNILTKPEPMTAMEWDHIYTHRSQTIINVLPNAYCISITFFPTIFFYSLKWSNTKKLWSWQYILQWIFN